MSHSNVGVKVPEYVERFTAVFSMTTDAGLWLKFQGGSKGDLTELTSFVLEYESRFTT
jgi:hypothetical protein